MILILCLRRRKRKPETPKQNKSDQDQFTQTASDVEILESETSSSESINQLNEVIDQDQSKQLTLHAQPNLKKNGAKGKKPKQERISDTDLSTEGTIDERIEIEASSSKKKPISTGFTSIFRRGEATDKGQHQLASSTDVGIGKEVIVKRQGTHEHMDRPEDISQADTYADQSSEVEIASNAMDLSSNINTNMKLFTEIKADYGSSTSMRRRHSSMSSRSSPHHEDVQKSTASNVQIQVARGSMYYHESVKQKRLSPALETKIPFPTESSGPNESSDQSKSRNVSGGSDLKKVQLSNHSDTRFINKESLTILEEIEPDEIELDKSLELEKDVIPSSTRKGKMKFWRQKGKKLNSDHKAKKTKDQTKMNVNRSEKDIVENDSTIRKGSRFIEEFDHSSKLDQPLDMALDRHELEESVTEGSKSEPVLSKIVEQRALEENTKAEVISTFKHNLMNTEVKTMERNDQDLGKKLESVSIKKVSPLSTSSDPSFSKPNSKKTQKNKSSFPKRMFSWSKRSNDEKKIPKVDIHVRTTVTENTSPRSTPINEKDDEKNKMMNSNLNESNIEKGESEDTDDKLTGVPRAISPKSSDLHSESRDVEKLTLSPFAKKEKSETREELTSQIDVTSRSLIEEQVKDEDVVKGIQDEHQATNHHGNVSNSDVVEFMKDDKSIHLSQAPTIERTIEKYRDDDNQINSHVEKDLVVNGTYPCFLPDIKQVCLADDDIHITISQI